MATPNQPACCSPIERTDWIVVSRTKRVSAVLSTSGSYSGALKPMIPPMGQWSHFGSERERWQRRERGCGFLHHPRGDRERCRRLQPSRRLYSAAAILSLNSTDVVGASKDEADVLQECKPLTSLPHEVNGSPTRLGDRGEAAYPSQRVARICQQGPTPPTLRRVLLAAASQFLRHNRHRCRLAGVII